MVFLWPGRRDKCLLEEDEHPQAVHLAALDEEAAHGGGAVRGVLSLFLPPSAEAGGRARFRKLATQAEWRGQGIGSGLVRTAVAEARRAGCSGLSCDAREAQAPFYERLGFRRCGEPFAKYGADGEMYVQMERQL